MRTAQNLLKREVRSHGLRHLVGVTVNEDVFLQDSEPVALHLEDAAAKRRAVEVHAKHQPLTIRELGWGDVLSVEVEVNRSKQ